MFSLALNWLTINFKFRKIILLQISSIPSESEGRHDNQLNNIQNNDIQHNDIQHNDFQHNNIQHNRAQHNGTEHKDTKYIV
jgi:hypothetical protein